MLPVSNFGTCMVMLKLGSGSGERVVSGGLCGLDLGALRLRLESQLGRVVGCVTIVDRCMLVLMVGVDTLTLCLCSPKRGAGEIMLESYRYPTKRFNSLLYSLTIYLCANTIVSSNVTRYNII